MLIFMTTMSLQQFQHCQLIVLASQLVAIKTSLFQERITSTHSLHEIVIYLSFLSSNFNNIFQVLQQFTNKTISIEKLQVLSQKKSILYKYYYLFNINKIKFLQNCFVPYCQFIFPLNKQTYKMSKTGRGRVYVPPQIPVISKEVRKIQQTLGFEQALTCPENCFCQLCRSKREYTKKQIFRISKKNKQQNSQKFLLRILNGLCPKGVPTLKLCIPDICFVDDEGLQIFYVDPRDSRIKKIQGLTPVTTLYSTMLKLKKKYKQMLQYNFHKIIRSQINPQCIHEKYLENILPSHFDNSELTPLLQQNKHHFMNYILHKDKKMLIPSIQQHNLNRNQPFCMVRFLDGTTQIFSTNQFQMYCSSNNVSQKISYVQSFIKQKQLQVLNFTSCYTFNSSQTDPQLFKRAQKSVLVLIGGLQNYSQQYEDLFCLQDITAELMRSNPSKYVTYMTYQIVHYLAMVAQIYVKHIKINWVLSDLGLAYIQSIFQFQSADIPLRKLKFLLPPQRNNFSLYKDTQHFINLYKQVQLMRERKKKQIRSQLLKEAQSTIESSNYATINFTAAPISQRQSQSLIHGNIKLKKQKMSERQLIIQKKSKKQKLRSKSLAENQQKYLQKQKKGKYDKYFFY